MADGAPLTPAQYDRYRRHLSLPEFGPEGQQALLAGRVLLIGAGGLGCPLAQYLAAAGVGRLGLVDFDVVDLSNLQRQVLYGTADIGRPKAEVAKERINALNPDVQVDTHVLRLDSSNAMSLFAEYDVIVDGTDNFPTRYLTNDACVLLGKPNVHGSIFRFDGQATVFDARHGPCYRCLYPEPPPPGAVPSCAEGGVLGVLPGLVAMIQAIRDPQAGRGRGRAALRSLAPLRRVAHGVRRVPVEEGCRLPRVWRATERHRVDRLCGVLRSPGCPGGRGLERGIGHGRGCSARAWR